MIKFGVIAVILCWIVGTPILKTIEKNKRQIEIEGICNELKEGFLLENPQINDISFSVDAVEYNKTSGRYVVNSAWTISYDGDWCWGEPQSVHTHLSLYFYDNEKKLSNGKRVDFNSSGSFTVVANGASYNEPKISYSSSKSDDTVKCKSCGREFEKGTENSKSILWKNMCVQCFENYEAAQNSLGRDVLGNPK